MLLTQVLGDNTLSGILLEHVGDHGEEPARHEKPRQNRTVPSLGVSSGSHGIVEHAQGDEEAGLADGDDPAPVVTLHEGHGEHG